MVQLDKTVTPSSWYTGLGHLHSYHIYSHAYIILIRTITCSHIPYYCTPTVLAWCVTQNRYRHIAMTRLSSKSTWGGIITRPLTSLICASNCLLAIIFRASKSGWIFCVVYYLANFYTIKLSHNEKWAGHNTISNLQTVGIFLLHHQLTSGHIVQLHAVCMLPFNKCSLYTSLPMFRHV